MSTEANTLFARSKVTKAKVESSRPTGFFVEPIELCAKATWRIGPGVASIAQYTREALSDVLEIWS